MSEKKQSSEPKEGNFAIWCSLTSSHGFVEFLQPRNILYKVLWSTFLLFCFTCLLVQLKEIAVDYINGPAFFTTIYETPSGPNGMQFPPLTICSYNRLLNKPCHDYGFNTHLQQTFFSLLHGAYPAFWKPQAEDFEELMAWQTQANASYIDILDYFSPSCYEVFAGCMINQNFYDLCDLLSNWDNGTTPPISIKHVYTEEFGRCLQLNFSNSQRAMSSGMSDGIRFFLTERKEDLTNAIVNNFWTSGFAIQIGSNIEPGAWISVSGGFQNQVLIKHKVWQFRASNYPVFQTPCTYETQSNLTYKGSPLPMSCVAQCKLHTSLSKCDCVPWYPTDQHRLCSVQQMADCVMSTLFDTQTNIDQTTRACMETCAEKCDYEGYEMMTNSAVFPAPHLRQLIEAQMKSMRNDTGEAPPVTALLDYSFSSTHTTVTERYERIRIEQLISNIGGQTGAWIGISIVTIAQFVVFWMWPPNL